MRAACPGQCSPAHLDVHRVAAKGLAEGPQPILDLDQLCRLVACRRQPCKRAGRGGSGGWMVDGRACKVTAFAARPSRRSRTPTSHAHWLSVHLREGYALLLTASMAGPSTSTTGVELAALGTVRDRSLRQRSCKRGDAYACIGDAPVLPLRRKPAPAPAVVWSAALITGTHRAERQWPGNSLACCFCCLFTGSLC